jgi:putative spermidine/putrescine transport system permease protein
LRSVLLAIACAFFGLLLVIPAVYWQKVRNPRIQPLLELMAAIPFAIPFVVIAFGLLTLSGNYAPQLQGTLYLLLPAYVAVTFSFVYWSIDSSMAAANISGLSEAATTCGAKPLTILWHVVLPNIGPGIASGAILAFGASFNEIALVQILAGNRFETVPLYMLNLLKNSNADFNKLAVMTSVTFFVTLALSIGVVYLNGRTSTQQSNSVPGKGGV